MDYPLSASQITCWLMCPRRYYFRYVARAKPEFISAALALGSAIHSAIEWAHCEWIDGCSPTMDDAARVFRADWASEQENGVRYKDGDTAADVGAVGEALVRLYVDQRPVKIRAAEVSFETPLVDPESGEVYPYTLRGFFDGITDDGSVLEIKSAARRPSAGEHSLRPQMALYRWAAGRLDPERESPAVVVVTLLKQKKPAIEVSRVPDTDDAFFVRLARDVGTAIDVGVFPPSPSAQNCFGCEYRRTCEASRGECRSIHDGGSAARIVGIDERRERFDAIG